VRLESVDGRRWAVLSVLRIEDIDRRDGSLYLWRLRFLATPWFGIYLHRIDADDGDRPEHDHPWPFVAVTLWGAYVEESNGRSRTRRPLAPHRHHATYRHAIRRLRRTPTWTLVIAGRRVRGWGYHTDGGWVPQKKFHAQRACLARLRHALADASDAHYISTYCIDAYRSGDPTAHLSCRLACKNCEAPCRCPCHTDGSGPPIPARQLEELLK
jgi:hypothetical protein